MDTELRALTKEQPVLDPKAPGGEIWAFPLSSWAFYHKLQQMEWIVQLGFELDIYRVDELGGMYWQVWTMDQQPHKLTCGPRFLQHLASTRIQHLERIRTFVTRGMPSPMSILRHKGKREAIKNCFSWIDFAMLHASATQSLADGLSCVKCTT